MSDVARIVEALRVGSRKRGEAGERRSAALEILRREMAGISGDEILHVLSTIREGLAPSDRESEAARLWEALSLLEAWASEAGAEANVGGAADLARAVLGSEGKEAAAGSPEVLERLGSVLRKIVDVLTRCDEALRRLNLDLRTHMMLEGRSGGTVVGLKLEEPIRKLIARTVLETGDVSELEKRVEGLAKSGILFHNAHLAANRQAWATIRQRLDPQAIQKEHGGKAWEAYRRQYHNELLDFGAEFEEQFVTKPFLQEYFRTLDKVK
ncbi:MAG: hypothetical protein LAO51_06920 [Acidobacteriia bacterium]|nr:hypothetical protein [Terriglobia bacterium]